MSGMHRSTSRRRGLAVGAVLIGMIAVAVGVLLIRAAGDHKNNSNAAAPAAEVASGATTSNPAPPNPVAATTPSTSATPPSSTTGTSVTATPSKSAAKTASAKPLTYTVKPGDNLYNIAAWFHMHGYGKLYDENKAVLGNDPALIHPGQKITISGTGMTTSN